MDTKQIKALMREFDDSGLAKLKISKEGFSIELEKAFGKVAVDPTAAVAAPATVPAATPAQAPATTSSAPKEISGDVILSPMVGTFYAAPSPDSPDFVKVGDVVKKGQVLGILEAMKIMNELEADFDCKIVDILVTNGQAVEYDMPLFAVEKL
jgi:acetyl-CoA carboxylase biotin carboxyl carrier protein